MGGGGGVQQESVIVPWFSRHEWMEVYHNAFSHDVDRWKDARDAMLVWQARVRKLPIGVDLTLPLIQAKIVDADAMVDDDVKSIMQGTALQRFVSSVVKLPQTLYYESQNMHKLAAQIGLPGHLVDLRNEIIHGDKGWAGGHTITEALETAYKWIKSYYWIPECHQMKNTNMAIDEAEAHTSDDWLHFSNVLDKYSFMVYDDSSATHDHVEASDDVIEAFRYVYPKHETQCMDEFVKHLLILPEAKEHLYKVDGKNPCRPKCFFTVHVVEAIDRIMTSVLQYEGATELLFTCLLRVKENHRMAVEWIKLLINSHLKLPPNPNEKECCQKHILHIRRIYPVNWKNVVVNFMQQEEEWSTNIAMRIINASEANFSESQIKKLTDLVKLFKSSGKINSSDSSQTEEFLDINALMDKSQTTAKVLQKIKSTELPASIKSSQTPITPLGILPHQVGNKEFYKQLLLHYPNERNKEPPCKRKRLN